MEDWTLLHVGAECGLLDVVQSNLKNTGAKDSLQQTALIKSVIRNHVECARLLLDEAGHKDDQMRQRL